MADDQIYTYVSDYIDGIIQENSSGFWQNSNIQRIRLFSVQMRR